METATGFEPVYPVLQTGTWPLGHAVLIILVPFGRLELPRVSSPVSKTGVSTIPPQRQNYEVSICDLKEPKNMAERQGFEPWAGFYPDSRLAGGRLKPLGHLSKTYFSKWRRGWDSNPRTFLGADCFRDSSNQPDSATPPYFVSKFGSNISLVPKAGLEPARVSPHAPQTCVSTIPPLRRFSLLFYSVYGPVDRIRTCTP